MQISNLNQKTAAELLGVTARTLRDWAEAPRNPDGSYSGPALVAWFAARDRGQELDPLQERARRDKESADKLQMANEVRRGELADMRDVSGFWTGCIANSRARLLGIPSKLAPRLVNIASAATIAAAIRAEVHAALSELAEYEPPAGERGKR